jgi:hypothetical protein
MRITATTALNADPGEQLTADDIVAWAYQLPPDARTVPLTPVLGNVGSQRDPETVLRGLTVTWETDADGVVGRPDQP